METMVLQKTDILITYRSVEGFRCEQYLRECVESVVKHTSLCYRFIFVDDASDATGREFIEKFADQFPTSILIRTRSQHWFTRATNLGLRMVRTPRAVALNSDTVCGEGWLLELYDIWEEVERETGAKVGLVGSTLSGEEPRRWAVTPNNVAGYVTGHAWLLNMTAMREAAEARGTPGAFLDQTHVDMAHIRSDIEICTRLNALGYLTVQSFKSRVDHAGGKSWGHNLSSLWSITQPYLNRLDGKD